MTSTVMSPTDGWWITGGELYPYDYYPQATTVKISNGQFTSGESVRLILMIFHCFMAKIVHLPVANWSGWSLPSHYG